MRTYILVTFLSLISAFCLAPHPSRACDTFDNITPEQIRDFVNLFGRTEINGSDNGDNEIPAGTILVYLTNENRAGKLQILVYGYNLTIQWVTYSEDGSVFSSGDQLVIRGTWLYDLDCGIEVGSGDDYSIVDVWWEQVDDTIRYWEAWNGAQFAVYQ